MDAREKELVNAAAAGIGGSPEFRLAARGEFAALLEKGRRDPEIHDAGPLIRRWRGVGSGRLHRMGIALLAATALMLPLWLVPSSDELGFYRVVSYRGWSNGPGKSYFEPAGKWGWTQEEMLVLFGDPSAPTSGGERKRLWERHPENVAYFADYAGVSLSVDGRLPAGFAETAARLDPDNAAFLYFQAADAARERADDNDAVAAGRRLDRAISLIAEGAGKNRFSTWRAEMARERHRLLPHGDLAGDLSGMELIRSAAPPVWNALAFILPAAVSDKAAELASAGDVAAFRALVGSAGKMTSHFLSAQDVSYSEADEIGRELRKMYAALATSANRLRLDGDARMLAATGTEVIPDVLLGQSAGMAKLVRDHGGVVESMAPLKRSNARIISRQSLLPGNLADHARLSRVMALVLALGFGLLAAVLWAKRFLMSPLWRAVPRRLALLMDWRDYAWIVLAGLVLPILYLMGISRFTPLGARGWSLVNTALIFPASQFLSLFLLMAAACILVCRWRLRRHTRIFGIHPATPWPGVASVILAAAFIPLAGWVVDHQLFTRPWLVAGGVLLGLPCLWLLSLGVAAVTGNPERRMGSAVMASVLLPAMGAAMLLMCALVGVFRAEEAWWHQRNTLLRAFPDFPAIDGIEADATVAYMDWLRQRYEPSRVTPDK